MPVLLFRGDNTLELDEAVHAVREPFQPADVLTYEGAIVPLPNLFEACLTAGLFDPQRLVVVHDLHDRLKGPRKEGGEAAEIKRLLTDIPPTTTLLLVSGDIAAEHPLVSDVRQAGGEVRSFTTPRKQDLPRWIIARARIRDVAMDRDAAELLVELVGANTVLLESELEKLATYAGNEQRITPPMVETLVGAVTQESIFTLVDAIAESKNAQALHLLHAQLEQASSGQIDFALYLIRMLARQVRILLRIRLGQEAGRSGGQISADLKLPRYYADRYFRQARSLSKQQLIDSFEKLAALEYALKSGKADAATGLDLLIADLSA
jgi:DNA polymerase III subunit delta